jgi:branched-chain amino acid transport system ATP-binding protein
MDTHEVDSNSGAPEQRRGKSLSLNDVHAGYGSIRALDGVSLRVTEGEFVAVVGANGAGKTTLLKLAAGLIQPWSGSVFFDKSDVVEQSTAQRALSGLCLVPEGRRVFPRMTVRENLLVGAHHRRDESGIADDFIAMYELFPVLRERTSQLAGTLSGGEQQMLAIARALMGRPQLLLLDEPSMGVAPLLVRAIFDSLARLHEKGLTVLVVEQNARLALTRASRGYVLESGKITLEGPASELLNNPEVQRAYLGGGGSE